MNRRNSLMTGAAPLILGAQSPAKKYTTALVGTGWWGMNILGEAMRSGECEVVGMCDVDETSSVPRSRRSRRRRATIRIIGFLVAAGVTIAVLPAAGQNETALFSAVRNGDLSFLSAHLTKTSLDVRDRRGATLLMHAAAFGNSETVKLLLDAGADVNARNHFNATALLWAARDPEKVKLLLARGADVNVRSKQGRTPLMLAALLHGGSSAISMLLKRRAEVNGKDVRGDTALGLAASIGEVSTMRLLLAHGADPHALNAKGESPLILATKSKRAQAVRLLLQHRADVSLATTTFNQVRHGPIAMVKLTALHRAAAFGPVDMVRDLLKAGADVNARDGRHLTPLMFAVATDNAQPPIVRLLLQGGADVNARDIVGETALDWAEKFQHPDILRTLRNAGARRGRSYVAPVRSERLPPQPAIAVSRSLALLQKTSAEFFTQSGCVGCHHQPLIARAQQAARRAGLTVEEKAEREQLLQIKAQWLASQEEFLQSINPGGGPNRLAENLMGLEAAGYAPDTITDSAVVDLAEAQAGDGSWPAGEEQPRPPMTESVIAATARAVRAVQAYTIPARKQEFTNRIERAREWLKKGKAITTEDYALRLLGLTWAGATSADLREAAQPLLALQRADGGWSGNRYLTSDAFSTAEALTALQESKAVTVNDARYRRGVKFLLDTQFPDGSWYVRSRTIKFQPFFESGFPFGHDQWISVAATAWAVQAIAPLAAPPKLAATARSD